MPETAHRQPLDLAGIRRRFALFRRYEDAAGGKLTGGEHVAAIASAWDVEPLLAEVDRLSHELAVWTFRAGLARGTLARLLAALPADLTDSEVERLVMELDEQLFGEQAAATSNETPVSLEVAPERATDVGGGDRRSAVEDQPPLPDQTGADRG
jgi:hypothetical protein